ncbi:glycosyltransferase family 4 protein [Patescibacteria group bacterium]|nr:glycosyltransferase family 4 protein [Patescibacteria group bacterium]
MNAPFALFTLDYPPERGGVARYLGDLVQESAGEMDVFVPETHAVTGPGHVETLPTFAPGPFSWRRLIWSILRLQKRGYRHLLVSHLLPVGTAAMIAQVLGGLPFTVLVHGLDVRLAMQRPRRRWLARMVLRRAQHVLVNSQAVAAEVHALDASLVPVVVTPGLRPRAFLSRSDARKQLSLEEKTFVCLTVARLVPRKGIDTMIRLLPSIPKNVRYVVIGSGQDEPRLRALAREFAVSDRVTFLTSCEDDERDRWLAAADLFVFLAREEGVDLEGFGIAPLEASSAGLPILAGRTGGVSEAVVDEETGLFVETKNAKEVYNTFMRLYVDPDLRQQLGSQGKTRTNAQFSWKERWSLVQKMLSL